MSNQESHAEDIGVQKLVGDKKSEELNEEKVEHAPTDATSTDKV